MTNNNEVTKVVETEQEKLFRRECEELVNMRNEDYRRKEQDDAELVTLKLERKEIDKKWDKYKQDKENKTIRTPLSNAVWDSNLILVQNLLKQQDIDVNQFDSDGRTPLKAAILQATGHNYEIVRLLVESGADVNMNRDSHATPFCAACDKAAGNLELIQFMVKHGADTKGALTAASRKGDMILVQVWS